MFRSVIDRFAYHEHRYINSWTDEQYMKSFIDPGNSLRMLHASNGQRGLVTIDEERPYRFVYTLRDVLGNTSKVGFTVQGKRSDIPQITHRSDHVLHWDRVNYLQKPGMDLLIPRGNLYDDVYLNFSLQADSGAVSFTYQLNDRKVPLHQYVDLSIALYHFPVADSTKYYIVSIGQHGKRSSVGGVVKNGWIHAKVRELGIFTVAVDTIPPMLTPVNQQQWSKNRRIVFKTRDMETGIRTYRGTIDGAYALFGRPNAVSGNLVCELDAARLQKGCRHQLEMTVTDECGNATTGRYTFYY
ncbi:peptidase family M23 [gut metagenome]|uniref:Peptidase family M23 n=1 Tax=gut metagenome TaxID=749906 RepID=J9FRZ0_9ZZZZ